MLIRIGLVPKSIFERLLLWEIMSGDTIGVRQNLICLME